MLQQTRVAAVIDRYGTFLERFPDVQSLANADVADVLTVWSGLGYYRRARALHQASRKIVSHGGNLPRTSEEWRKLPGIGRYTAAAIASIAHGEPCAVVDGNVERVLRRVTGNAAVPVPDVWETASAWLSRRSPGDFNQAMMELGATVCLPVLPRCNACPLHSWCVTRGVLEMAPAAVRQRRDVAYALSVKSEAIYLKKRKAGERLMPDMWELPEITPNGHAPEFTVRHAITVTDFRVSVFRTPNSHRGGRWVKIDRIGELPLTGLTCKILRRASII